MRSVWPPLTFANVTASAAVAAVLGVLAFPASSAAAPPPNDNRANAQVIDVPSSVDGTTVESTLEPTEPSGCESSRGSVWYRYDADADSRVVVDLQANGDLDGSLAVYRARRSQLSLLDCDESDDNGRASVALDAARGNVYFIRVTQRQNSEPGTFRVKTSVVRRPASPPGRDLPKGGVSDSVNRTLNPSDAWSVRLSENVTYRINAASSNCVEFGLYRPGTKSFSSRPIRSSDCGGYLLFTPRTDEGGRYSIRIAMTDRGSASYRLTVAPATPDDTTPGTPLGNYDAVGGSLDGRGIDVVDLYRFNVDQRSGLELDLRTKTNFDIELLNTRGRLLRCACRHEGNNQLRIVIPPGRYFVLLKSRELSAGSYRLTRITRTVTRTQIAVSSRSVPPGGSVLITARISSSASGTTLIGVERFDPDFGWQSYRRYTVRASGGQASVAFQTPFVARFRARARYMGSRALGPSGSGWREFEAVDPLRR
jgi:hypothetical protein